MKRDPFITVFTPNYNGAKYISETIESIINQTYTNFEYIIIDDCSTDKSWDIIQKYAKLDKKIRAFRNQKNLNIAKTRNLGFKLSSDNSKYFAIIDSDDVALPNRLKIQVKFLEKNPDYGLVGSDIFIINGNSQLLGYRKYPSTHEDIMNKIIWYDPIAQSSVLLRMKAIKKIGYYDEKLNTSQDYDYWLRLGRFWKLKNIKTPLIKYRLSQTQIKVRKLKTTTKNIYLIQKRAIKIYGYKDSVYNQVVREIFIAFPKKIMYFFYKMLLIKDSLIMQKNPPIFNWIKHVINELKDDLISGIRSQINL